MKKVCFREQKEKLKDRIGRQRNKKGSCLKKIIRKSLTFPARCSFLQILTVFSNGVIIYRHKKSFAPGQKRPVSDPFRSEIYGKNRGTFVKLMGHM